MKYLPIFFGDTNQDPNDHIKVIIVACRILCVYEENFFVRLFVASLIGSVVDWFHNLLDSCITCWNDLEVKFLHRFIPAVDVGRLLLNFFQIKIK